MEKWNPLRKIKVTPTPVFEPKVEIYALESGGKWAVSLHASNAMRVLTGDGGVSIGIEQALMSIKGRQHVAVMTDKDEVFNDFGHVVKRITGCHAGPHFDRLRVALSLSQGGNEQMAGRWNEGQPEYMGRQKKK